MILESNLIVKHLVSFTCCQPQRRTPVFSARWSGAMPKGQMSLCYFDVFAWSIFGSPQEICHLLLVGWLAETTFPKVGDILAQ